MPRLWIRAGLFDLEKINCILFRPTLAERWDKQGFEGNAGLFWNPFDPGRGSSGVPIPCSFLVKKLPHKKAMGLGMNITKTFYHHF
jgi:hypothetical protein